MLGYFYSDNKIKALSEEFMNSGSIINFWFILQWMDLQVFVVYQDFVIGFFVIKIILAYNTVSRTYLSLGRRQGLNKGHLNH